MASPESPSVISLEYRGRVAIITINNEKKLNALNQMQYYDLASKLREVATRDDVYVTLLIGKGRFFSAGADVSTNRPTDAEVDNPHLLWLRSFVAFNLNITQAFYSHPKILVVGLNGPCVGLSAAITAHADFVYAVPDTYLLTPFSSLGLVAEGNASRALLQRLGPARGHEALIMSKRITADELVQCGYVNKVFTECGKGDSDKFRELVLKEIDERLGDHLVGDSMLGIKKLIRAPDREIQERQVVNEVFDGLDRFLTGVPQAEFAKVASGKKRHKL